MSYDNNLTGVLFPNNKKQEGSKQPDYNGSCEIEGKTYEIAGWKRQSNAGKPFLSLKLQIPQGKSEKPRQNEKKDSELDTPF